MITLILPVYNVEEYLPQCLESLINQTYKELEIICVNDASTDNSLKVLKDYASKDSRIKIIDLEENQGQGVARNMGLNIATGEYISFVDPDDWCSIDMFEKMLAKATETDADLVECSATIYNEEEHTSTEMQYLFGIDFDKPYNWKDLSNKELLFTNKPAPWGKLCKASVIKENEIRFGESRFAEDAYFSIKMRFLSKKIIHLNKHYYYYRIRNSSTLTNLNSYNLTNQVELVYKTKKFLEENGFFTGLESSFDKLHIKQLTKAYENLDEKYRNEFKKQIKEKLGPSFYSLFEKKIKQNYFKQIFAVGNKSYGTSRYKILTIFGKDFRIKKIY